MNSQLGVKDLLVLLDTLKGELRGFTAQEAKLTGEAHKQSAAAAAAFESQSRQQRGEFSDGIDAAHAIHDAARQRAEAQFARRKTRIGRARNSAHNHIVETVRRQEDQRKFKIQQASLAAERQRDAVQLAAENVLNEFNRAATETAESLIALETDASKTFGSTMRKLLVDEQRWSAPDLTPDENQLLAETRRLITQTREDVARFQKSSMSGVLGTVFKRSAINTAAIQIAGQLVKARWLFDTAQSKAAASRQQESDRIVAEFAATNADLNQQWQANVKWGVAARASQPTEIEQTVERLHRKNEQHRDAALQRADRDHTETLARVQQIAATQARQLADAYATKVAQLEAAQKAEWATLEADWRKTIQPIYDQIQRLNAEADKLYPGWDASVWKDWSPPVAFTNAAKFGCIEVDLKNFAEGLPKDSRLPLPGPASFSVPLALSYPLQGSLLLETAKAGGDEAVRAINNIIFQLLATTPPGKLSFTFFDPVGLGQNFAGLMHLADYEASHINSRIWTQPNQFEEKLAELSEHMEKVIQMYLRNEYATITEYNAQAGSIAEKYHFLVIASFPVNFSDTAARRLRNIAASGARCGVYTLIHWDQRNQPPQDFVPDELRKNSVRLVHTEKGFELADWRSPGAKLVLDPPPAPEFATDFLRQVGERGKDSSRVEVPFAQIAPSDAEVWLGMTTNELRVPIGRSGATKLQYLAIGRDTRQHALIAGKTGSGKSTLFHVIITNLALWCSPEEVEFYLVDFKKGVEFKCYASRKLPHARVVAIESDRAFGLSVLQRLDDELRRRGDLFRKVGAQDLAGYKRAGGLEVIPRSLLIIDEFQEFFTEEDRISQGAAVLLDRIVRQGRAFGIHVLLGSQTLGGAYTLARATIGQMVIRIALQCNEADAYLIMDQDNPAPRLLTRPGEGIYNDTAGSIEGNSPFQAVWLADTVRDDYLQKIRERAGQPAEKYPGPFVFEGNAPADVRENAMLNALLKERNAAFRRQPGGDAGALPPKGGVPAMSQVWLGAPNSIKGPTEARFQRQSGSNLLVVGQNDEATLSMLAVSLVSLAAQYPVGAARFVLFDSTLPDSPERGFLDRMVSSIPHEIVRVKGGDVAEAMNGLAQELKGRGDDQSAGKAPETFLLIHGLHNFKKLRQEDDFSFSSSGDSGMSPAAVLLELLKEGSAVGLHVVATCDTYNNVHRCLGRKNLGEFEMRVLFQMSASDSASLIDAPDAATLGLHRALYYNDREGYLEIFRPYAKPGNDWLETVMTALRG